MADIVETLRDGCDCGSAKDDCPAKEACQDAFEAADEIERLRAALRKISNMGQTNVPDHWDFRVKAREIARSALGKEKE